jgi:hypothetical protein
MTLFPSGFQPKFCKHFSHTYDLRFYFNIYIFFSIQRICYPYLNRMTRSITSKYRVIKKEVYNFKNLFYKYYWTYGDVLYICIYIYIYIYWREKPQSYFHTLQALDVSPTCDTADVKSIIQLFSHWSQHVTGNSSHSLSDSSLQIIDIRTLRGFISIRTGGMDLASVVFVQ